MQHWLIIVPTIQHPANHAIDSKYASPVVYIEEKPDVVENGVQDEKVNYFKNLTFSMCLIFKLTDLPPVYKPVIYNHREYVVQHWTKISNH